VSEGTVDGSTVILSVFPVPLPYDGRVTLVMSVMPFLLVVMDVTVTLAGVVLVGSGIKRVLDKPRLSVKIMDVLVKDGGRIQSGTLLPLADCAGSLLVLVADGLKVGQYTGGVNSGRGVNDVDQFPVTVKVVVVVLG
jgi:hypothetical protein